ncbi:MAG: tetratricopeptide repeat protein [Chloroflexi bacterium]|nr:tetratricopeptide repeat protein [Chloroflexota bacterium]
MNIPLTLQIVPTPATADAPHLEAIFDGRTLARTPLATLQHAPTGHDLFAALGGNELYEILRKSHEPTLGLFLPPALDDPTHHIPWETAHLPDGRWLVQRYGMVRLVTDGRTPAPTPPGRWHFLALSADPLVERNGTPRTGYKLALDDEMIRIQHTLHESGRAIRAQWLPPTAEALGRALLAGHPALLHLSCHGQIIPTTHGPLASLLLEDECGRSTPLLAPDLLSQTSGNNLRFVLLSACRTGTGGQVNLAHALVREGLPAAIGMQGDFPDDLSTDFAAALYEALLAGRTLPHALRAARQALSKHPQAIHLPVLYARAEGLEPLAVPEGTADLGRLDPTAHWHLTSLNIPQPQHLFGREKELHQLATTFNNHRIVTITGAGGMGKTFLATSFIRRFGARWPAGGIGLSFANAPLVAAQFRATLLEGLQQRLDLPTERQEPAILQALAGWQGLVLIDNYETVQHALALPPAQNETDAVPQPSELHSLLLEKYSPAEVAQLVLRLREQTLHLASLHFDHFEGDYPEKLVKLLEYLQRRETLPLLVRLLTADRPARPTPREPYHEALAIHRLLTKMAVAGANLLLTTRQRPTGLPGEQFYPSRDEALQGVAPLAGAKLFLHHCAAARERRHEPAYAQLAQEVAQVTAGHPLAIALLASEFNNHPTTQPATFLADWPTHLSSAHQQGADAHHDSLSIAFQRSYDKLTPTQQAHLRLLSGLETPFLPEALAFVVAASALSRAEEQRSGGAEETPVGAGLVPAQEAEETTKVVTTNLQPLVDASLLEMRRYETARADGTPVTWLVYQFQPALRQMAHQQMGEAERTAWPAAFACYAEWLLEEGYGIRSSKDITNQGNAPLGKVIKWALPYLTNVFEQMVNKNQIETNSNLFSYGLYLGWFQNWFGQTEDATKTLLATWNKVKDIDISFPDSGIQEVMSAIAYLIGNIYTRKGKFEEALKFYGLSLELDQQQGNLDGISGILREVASIHSSKGNFQYAIFIYEKSLQFATSIKTEALTWHEIANLYSKQQEFKLALNILNDLLPIYNQLGDLHNKAVILYQIATIYMAQEQFNDALNLCEQIGTIQEEIGDTHGACAHLLLMTDIKIAQKQWAEAQAFIDKGQELALEIDDHVYIAHFSHRHGFVLHEKGNSEEASRKFAESLSLFQHLQMNVEIQKTQESIMKMDLQILHKKATRAYELGNIGGAIELQRQAIDIARQASPSGNSEHLYSLLSELASYYLDGHELQLAIDTQKEANTIGEKLGYHSGIDQKILEAFAELTIMEEERKKIVSNLSFEQRFQAELEQRLYLKLLRVLENISEEEIKDEVQQIHLQLSAISSIINAVTELGKQHRLGQIPEKELIEFSSRTEKVAQQIISSGAFALHDVPLPLLQQIDLGEEAEPLSQFLLAVAARLRGESPPPIPPRYASAWAEMG